MDSRLDKRLDALVEQDSFEKVAFDIIKLSQQEGWTDKLVEALQAERPRKPNIMALIGQAGGGATTAKAIPAVPAHGAGRAQPAIQTWLLGTLIALVSVVAAVFVYDRMFPRQLTFDEYNDLLEKAREEVARENPEEDARAVEEKAKEKVEAEQGRVVITTKFWPGNTVPYEISPDFSGKDDVLAAIAEYQSKTNVRFVERNPGNAGAFPDYIRFKDAQGCWSFVGVQGGGQDLSAGAMCGYAQTLHEIGHALGLYHEHTRPDRDGFIQVNWDNMARDSVHHFTKDKSSVNQRRPYDYESIMHFPPNILSINGKPTIEPLLSSARVGPTGHLSAGDILLIDAVYPKPAQAL
jgi:hypothetical protein